MKRWEKFERFHSAPKKAPPEHGIRMNQAGTTWWGQRWIEALEQVLRADSGRLSRGKTYARAGRTHDLVVQPGKVSAKVTGTRDAPYEITISLDELDDAAWQRAIDGMVRKAQFSAELLAGQMPREIEQVFREAGVSLFPKQRKDLKTSCSCPDSGDPCKHVAATHYVLGEAFDRDPFLLFELRGRTKQRVLDALRTARGGTTSRSVETASVRLGKLKAADYDKPREALPALHFTFEEPAHHGAVLRQLGELTNWRGDGNPADALAPLVRAAAETARRMAMAEPDPPQSAPTAAKSTPRSRSKRGRNE